MVWPTVGLKNGFATLTDWIRPASADKTLENARRRAANEAVASHLEALEVPATVSDV